MMGIGPPVPGMPDKLALLDNGADPPLVATVPPKIALGNGMGNGWVQTAKPTVFVSKLDVVPHWIIKPPGTSGMRT